MMKSAMKSMVKSAVKSAAKSTAKDFSATAIVSVIVICLGVSAAAALVLGARTAAAIDYVSLSASPSSVNFIDQQVGTGSQTQYVYIYNQGTEDAKNIYVSGACDSSFTVSNNCFGDLRPQGSCSLNIQFRPTVASFHSCSLYVSTTNGGSALITIQGNAHL